MQATQIIAKFQQTKSEAAGNEKQFNGKIVPKDFLQKQSFLAALDWAEHLGKLLAIFSLNVFQG